MTGFWWKNVYQIIVKAMFLKMKNHNFQSRNLHHETCWIWFCFQLAWDVLGIYGCLKANEKKDRKAKKNTKQKAWIIQHSTEIAINRFRTSAEYILSGLLGESVSKQNKIVCNGSVSIFFPLSLSFQVNLGMESTLTAISSSLPTRISQGASGLEWTSISLDMTSISLRYVGQSCGALCFLFLVCRLTSL